MDLKEPLTISEQINRLKAHGIIIENEAFAIKILNKVNYYRLTGYILQNRKSENDSNITGNVKFDEIYDIYKFDEEMRQMLRKYIERIEIYCRTQIAYHFSITKCQNPHHDQHYDENNYYNKKGFKEIVTSFAKQKKFYFDSPILKHHRNKYNDKLPLWVIVEFLSFSNLSKFYKALYYSEKDTIANSMGTTKETLENHLHCLTILRNKCAHAARLYNTEYRLPAKLPRNFLKKHPYVLNNSLFAYVYVLLKRLPSDESKIDLINELKKLIISYGKNIDISKIGFPNNYLDILLK